MICIDVLGGIAHYLKSVREDFIISCFEYPRAACQIKKINQTVSKLKEAEKLIMSAGKLIADDWTLTKQSEPNNPLPVCDCEKCVHYHVCHYNLCGLSLRPKISRKGKSEMTTLEFEIDDNDAGYKYVAPLIKKICEDHEKHDLHIKVKLNGIADYSESEESKDFKAS